jgi:RNA polymerase-binding protein DksA
VTGKEEAMRVPRAVAARAAAKKVTSARVRGAAPDATEPASGGNRSSATKASGAPGGTAERRKAARPAATTKAAAVKKTADEVKTSKGTSAPKAASANGAATKTDAGDGATPTRAAKTAKSAPAKGASAKSASAKAGSAKAGPAKTAAKAPAAKAPAKAAAKAPAKAAKSAGKAATKPSRPEKVASAKLATRPDETPWTEEELAEVRAELETQTGELKGEISEAEQAWAEQLRDSGEGAGDDQADAGTKTFEREHELSLASNTRELLAQVERALMRIDSGTYGICENCGNPIGKARLQAFPRATLCVSCKQREERR